MLSPGQKAAATRRANLAAMAAFPAHAGLAPKPELLESSNVPAFVKAEMLVNQLTSDELRALNKLIIARVSAASLQKALQASSKLYVGQPVKWESRKAGTWMFGTVEKINTKNVVVFVSGQGRWNVFAGFLQAA